MPGYRGIFLDSIHPSIVKRLDFITMGYQRKNLTRAQHQIVNSFQRNDTVSGLTADTQIYSYLQERNSWIRAVPFGVPSNYIQTDKYGETTDLAAELSVPNWKDWILYGTKAKGFHSLTLNNETIKDGQDYSLRTSHNVTGVSTDGNPHGIYNHTTTGWDGAPTAGVLGSPPPGITSIQISNKGDLGTIRRASIDIKVHNLADLEAIEMMYMVPGISILLEWGWYHPDLYMDPIPLNAIQQGQPLSSTKAINTEILLRTFGLNEPGNFADEKLLHNFEDPLHEPSTWGPGEDGLKAGIYDGLLGVITKFNWTNDGAGGYDCRIDIIAPGSLATGISVESYALGSVPIDEETQQEVPKTDIATLAALVSTKTRGLESDTEVDQIKDEYKKKLRKVKYVERSGDVGSISLEHGGEIKVPNNELRMSGFGVNITVEEGKVVFSDVTDKPTDTSKYYIGEAGGGKRFVAKTLRGHPGWFKKLCAHFGQDDWENHFWQKGSFTEENAQSVVNVFGSKENRDFATVMNTVKQCVTQGKFRVKKAKKYWNDMDHDPARGEGPASNTAALGGKGWGNANEGDSAYKYNGKYREWRLEFWRAGRWSGVVADFEGQPFDFNNYDWDNISGEQSWERDKGHASFYGLGGWDTNSIPNSKVPKMVEVDAMDPGTIPDGAKTYQFIEDFGMTPEKQKKFEDDNGITRDDQGNVKNKEGDTIAQSGDPKMGTYDLPIKYEKVEALTLYKKAADGTVTKVSDITADSADAIANRLKAITKEFAQERIQDAIDEADKDVNKAVNLIMSAANPEMVSWLDPFDIKSSVAHTNENTYPDGVVVYATNKPDSLPEYELGYSNLNIDHKGESYIYHPIGVVAYGQTFITWRYIEDYIINELYMPKSTITLAPPPDTEEGDEDGETQATDTEDNGEEKEKTITTLENIFQTVTVLSDRDKKNILFASPDEIARVASTLTPEANLELKLVNNMLDDASKDAIVYRPDCITNHQFLRSFNANVCIIPGQESPPVFPGMGGGGNSKMLDSGGTVDPFIRESNLFAGTVNDVPGGETDFSKGILRNILINAEIVKEAAVKEDNVRKFAGSILNAVNEACGEPWSFKITTNGSTGQIKVVDENYVGEKDNYKERITNQDDNGTYLFSGAGSDNILENVKITSKIPNELQTMAYYSAIGSDSEKGSGISMFNMYRAGITDYLKNLTNVSIIGAKKNSEAANVATNALLVGYTNFTESSRGDVIDNKGKVININRGLELGRDFVKKYVHGDTIESPGYSPPIPIDVSFDMQGVSGIFMGNAVMIRTVSEGGILPNRYRNVVALQTTAVDHSVTVEGWKTSVTTLMRPLPDTPTADRRSLNSSYRPPPVFTPLVDSMKGLDVTAKEVSVMHPEMQSLFLDLVSRMSTFVYSDGTRAETRSDKAGSAYRSLIQQLEKYFTGKSGTYFGNHVFHKDGVRQGYAIDFIDKNVGWDDDKGDGRYLHEWCLEVGRIIKDVYKYKHPDTGTKISWGGDWFGKNGTKGTRNIELHNEKLINYYGPTADLGWDPVHIELVYPAGVPSSETARMRIVEASLGYPDGFITKITDAFKGDKYSTKKKRKALVKSGEISADSLYAAFKQQGVDVEKFQKSGKMDAFDELT